MGRYEARADIRRNRLYVVLEGFISDAEAKDACDTTIAEASKLMPGFDIINDISTVKPASPHGVTELLRCQTFLRDRGIGRVIRVVPKLSVGAMQISRTGKEAGYDADTATSIEEAEKMLEDQKKKPH